MQEYPILYSFRRCPYAMRARYALVNAGIKCHLREVYLRDKPTQLLEISPKGTVPVLQLTDGRIIEESLDIVIYALKINEISIDDKKIIDRNDKEFAKLLRQYKYHDRYPDRSQDEYRKDIEQDFLNEYEKILLEQEYFNGNDIGIVDIAIFPFIRQFAFVDEEWFYNSEYTAIQKWLDRILSSPLFEKTMQREEPWKSGDPVIIFPS